MSDTLRSLPLAEAERDLILKLIPACYVAIYVLGTVFTARFLSSIVLRMLGGLDKVKADIAAMEQQLDSSDSNLAPGIIPARRKVVFRACDVSDSLYDTSLTPAEISEHYAAAGVRVIVVERARINGASVVEILQNCVIFNNGIHNPITDKTVRADRTPHHPSSPRREDAFRQGHEQGSGAGWLRP